MGKEHPKGAIIAIFAVAAVIVIALGVYFVGGVGQAPPATERIKPEEAVQRYKQNGVGGTNAEWEARQKGAPQQPSAGK